MESFIDLFGSTMLSLYTFPKPVVAAVSGHAVAGGCVMCLNADWRVLRRGVRIGLNEVKVGVPLPYGVAILVREMVHRPHLTEIALLGNNFSDERAVEVGLGHEVHDAEGFEAHCLSRAREFAERDLAAFAITKKYLRSTALERMRVGDSPYRREFLDCWFSQETRGRIEAIVAGLKKG
jgi:enoyl-CoA hydratase